MRFFVKTSVFESIQGEEDVKRLRRVFGRHLEEVMMPSGKVETCGVFADARAQFFILDVDSPAELMALFGGPILDHFTVETHPICTFDELKELFAREG